MTTLDLFSAPVARLLERGAQLGEVARALGQPLARISEDGQILTLAGSAPLVRVLVYRVQTSPLFWMILTPERGALCRFSAHDQSLGFDRLADLLQRAIK